MFDKPLKFEDLVVRHKEYIYKKLGHLITDKFINWLDEIGYFKAPASAIAERNYEGALFVHSRLVAENLSELTQKLILNWSRPESPYIVGLFHDIDKAIKYNPKEHKVGDLCDYYVAGDNRMYELISDPDHHGYNSAKIIKNELKLTLEEEACIEFHQGAFVNNKIRWVMYNDRIRMYPNILFTHTADMIASQLIELNYNWRIGGK